MDFIGFQQKERQDSQNFNNDANYRPSKASVKCVIGTEKYPDAGILIIFDDEFSQGYGQIKEVFRALTKDDILEPYKSDNDFRSSNNGNDVGYNLYVFDLRYRRNLESAQTIKAEFEISEIIPAGIYGHALVLTNKLVSINSAGQRHFDLI